MASYDEQKSVNLLNVMIEELVLQPGVKGAVILLDKESSKVSFASAFPSNKKLVYANVGFASASSGQNNMYFEYENDEGDEKKVAEEERKNKIDCAKEFQKTLQTNSIHLTIIPSLLVGQSRFNVTTKHMVIYLSTILINIFIFCAFENTSSVYLHIYLRRKEF